MKKILFAVIGFTVLSCANPSIEEGLANLEEQLLEIEATLAAADVEGMIADLDTMTAQVQAIETNQEELLASITEAEGILGQLSTRLAGILETLEAAATVEQVQNLRAQVEEISEGIQMLVFLADYDYDGVMNGLDQCPQTPIEEINNVDAVGCIITD